MIKQLFSSKKNNGFIECFGNSRAQNDIHSSR